MKKEIDRREKKHYCTPIARILPFLFLLGILEGAYLLHLAFTDPEQKTAWLWLAGVVIALSLCAIIFSLRLGSRYVLIYDDRLVCKCPLCKDIVMEYDKCTVGMDYATTTGATNLWIYLVYGMLPKYRFNSEANRINSVKFRDGFVKIMYSDEVYNALLEVLPKKQRNGLISGYKMFFED